MASLLVTIAVLALFLRAHFRGENHIAARYAAAVALWAAARFGYAAYKGEVSISIVLSVVVGLAIFSQAIAKGRLHAPPS